jgi:hypothetical protein
MVQNEISSSAKRNVSTKKKPSSTQCAEAQGVVNATNVITKVQIIDCYKPLERFKAQGSHS